ncbi:MAG: class I SAM-dependent methyltransferase [Reyranellaceae bacterium]
MPRRRSGFDALLRALGGAARPPARPAARIIETDPGAAALDGLWQHMAQVWSELGREEPLLSVLPEPRYRTAARPSARTLARFHASGRAEVERLDALLADAGVILPNRALVAEYGCGVGRTTRWLAERFARVRGFDISAPHLARAEQHLEQAGRGNVELVPLRRRQELALLQGVDLFFSRRVLQHNPPPLQRGILDQALAGLGARPDSSGGLS